MSTDPYLPSDDSDGIDPDDQAPPTPLSFKIMVGLAVLYLGWRLVEGVMWLVDWLF